MEESKMEKETLKMEELNLKNNSTILWDPNYLSIENADNLFTELKLLEFNQAQLKMWGKNMNVPRLQNWMADKDVTNTDKTSKKYAALYQKTPQLDWSPSVLHIKKRLEKDLNCTFDYVLINLYRDGNDYISYHADKEASGDTNCVIASLSMGASRKFVLKHNDWKSENIPKQEFVLTHGSLIVMKDDVQKYWKHAIMKTKKECGERINLTFRIC